HTGWSGQGPARRAVSHHSWHPRDARRGKPVNLTLEVRREAAEKEVNRGRARNIRALNKNLYEGIPCQEDAKFRRGRSSQIPSITANWLPNLSIVFCARGKRALLKVFCMVALTLSARRPSPIR